MGTIYCNLAISRKYKVTLCLKNMSKNHIIFNVCYRWWNATFTVNSMQKLASHRQPVHKFQDKTNAHTKYKVTRMQSKNIQGFLSFCFISQGILNDCAASPSVINWTSYNCSRGDTVFIQSSDSCDRQSFKQEEGNRPEREERGCLVSSLFATMTSG